MAKKATKKFIVLIDNDKKVITIDKTVKPADGDMALLTAYITAGYKTREKSIARAEAKRKEAKQAGNIAPITDDEILEALKDKQEELKKYNELKKSKGGFFSAKSYYWYDVCGHKRKAKK